MDGNGNHAGYEPKVVDMAKKHHREVVGQLAKAKSNLNRVVNAPDDVQLTWKRDRWGGRNWVPLSELYEHPELCTPPAFDWKPYLARGRVSLLSVAPKAGKSTLAAYYAVATAMGAEWMGQSLEPGNTLWVGPDEHVGDIIHRFNKLDAPGDSIGVWVAAGPDPEPIAIAAEEHGSSLIVMDTLPRIAQIEDENDNAAWGRWFDRALPIMRDSGCSWLAIHHDRKSGGEHGEGIRGASAIFASVDIAISLRRVKDHARRRVLRIEGSRYENVEDQMIELQEDGRYVALGDPRKVRDEEDEDLAAMREAISSTPQTVQELADRLGIVRSTARRRLDRCVERGWANRSGTGKTGSPYRYAVA